MVVESNDVWNERQSLAALRLMKQVERTSEPAERRSLARASERLFWASIGVECPRILRERAAGEPALSRLPGLPADTRKLG